MPYDYPEPDVQHCDGCLGVTGLDGEAWVEVSSTPMACVFMTDRQRSKGAMLVLPRRHVQRFAELHADEVKDIAGLIRRAVWAVKAAFNPDGMHLWTSAGLLAGQSLRHMHFQIVPRYRREAYSFAPSDALQITDYLSRMQQATQIRSCWPNPQESVADARR